jgi:hypothetical protein
MRTELRGPDVGRPVRGPVDRSAPVRAAVVDSLLIALVYLMIGTKLVTVIDPPDDQPAFGLAAAGFFVGFAVVLWLVRRPFVWVAGIVIQLFIVYVYLDLASERVPSFEGWGIALRVLQVPLIAILAFLAIGALRRRPADA